MKKKRRSDNSPNNSFGDGTVLSVHVSSKVYDDLTQGRNCTRLISRGDSHRSICYMTVGIHMYANALWIFWDTIKYFTMRRRKGVMELEKGTVCCEFA